MFEQSFDEMKASVLLEIPKLEWRLDMGSQQ